MSIETQEVPKPPLVNVTAATAQEVCARLYLDKAALALLQPAMDPREFVEALVAGRHYLAAIDVIAHSLPAHSAIWWGCLSLQRTIGDKLEPWERRALRLAVQWALQPDEMNRAATKQPAEVLGPASAAGSLAGAVSQTGGSVGPPQGPPIAPHPFAPARGVAMAIKMASSKSDPPEIQPTQRALIELGMAIAEGRFAPPRKD